ncbi:MAG: urease accessory protein UreE [Pseudomonadota bacterium]
MEMFTGILGSSDDPALAGPLHRLEHIDGVDELRIPRADLARRRLRAVTTKGADIAIALPREMQLFDGAVLRCGSDSALVVRVEAEHWLRVRPADTEAALRLGYHAGNLHWRVRFDGIDLLVALEGPEERYRDRLVDMVADGTCIILQEEPA